MTERPDAKTMKVFKFLDCSLLSNLIFKRAGLMVLWLIFLLGFGWLCTSRDTKNAGYYVPDIERIIYNYGKIGSYDVYDPMPDAEIKKRTTFINPALQYEVLHSAIGVIGLIPVVEKNCIYNSLYLGCTSLPAAFTDATRTIMDQANPKGVSIKVGMRVLGFSQDYKYTFFSVSVMPEPYSEEMQKFITDTLTKVTTNLMTGQRLNGNVLPPDFKVGPITDFPIILSTFRAYDVLRNTVAGHHYDDEKIATDRTKHNLTIKPINLSDSRTKK